MIQGTLERLGRVSSAPQRPLLPAERHARSLLRLWSPVTSGATKCTSACPIATFAAGVHGCVSFPSDACAPPPSTTTPSFLFLFFIANSVSARHPLFWQIGKAPQAFFFLFVFFCSCSEMNFSAPREQQVTSSSFGLSHVHGSPPGCSQPLQSTVFNTI